MRIGGTSPLPGCHAGGCENAWVSRQLTEVKAGPRRRSRLGVRGLMAVVLMAGVALACFARQDRLASDRTARIAELRRMGVLVNDFEPTFVGLLAMRVFGSLSSEDVLRPNRWLGPGWYVLPRGFNAGMLPDDRVAEVAERIGHFGKVIEVRFDRPPLTGLRLFYIDRVPYDRLGVPRDAVHLHRAPRRPTSLPESKAYVPGTSLPRRPVLGRIGPRGDDLVPGLFPRVCRSRSRESRPSEGRPTLVPGRSRSTTRKTSSSRPSRLATCCPTSPTRPDRAWRSWATPTGRRHHVFEGGGGRFVDVLLQSPGHPGLGRGRRTLCARLHHAANRDCFIAKSVNFPVRHESTIVLADG